MTVLTEDEVERALVVIAHPDDAESWAGGTIARWTDAGVAVTSCVLTDGDAGGYDLDVPRSCAASSCALSARSGRSGSSRGARSGIGSASGAVIPTTAPPGSTLDAIYPDAGNPFAHLPLLEEAGLKAWTVAEGWLVNSPNPNHYVDVTETFDRKVAAVQAHASQVGNRENLAEELRRRIASNSVRAGLPADRLVEAFQVVATG